MSLGTLLKWSRALTPGILIVIATVVWLFGVISVEQWSATCGTFFGLWLAITGIKAVAKKKKAKKDEVA